MPARGQSRGGCGIAADVRTVFGTGLAEDPQTIRQRKENLRQRCIPWFSWTEEQRRKESGMKEYVKPVVLENEELMEGVYAASGDCWDVSAPSTQDWNGNSHEFEVRATHNNDLEHISGQCTVRLVFSNTISNATAEAETCTWSGNTVTVTRKSHGNAYLSGDKMSFKVRVACADEASTRSVTCTSVTCTYCDHQTNVQGGYD